MSYRSFKRVLGETSLERKCRFLFGACLLLLIAGSFWFYGKQTENLVHKQDKLKAELLVDTFLKLKHWETFGNTPVFADYAQQLSSELQTHAYECKFLRASGPKQQELSPEERAILDLFRTTPADSDDFLERRFPSRKEYEYYQPIYATTSKCIECHRVVTGPPDLTENDLMAVAKVRISTAETIHQLNVNRAILLSTAIITVFLAMIASYVIVRYVIVKPLKHLRDVSDAVSRGDIEQRAEIRTADEFEELGVAFNRMLRHLVTAQDELRQANVNLDQKVDELAQVNMRLFEMNRLKGDFLATMSHELRTPLNSIIGFSDVLDSIKSLDEKQKRYVQNIQKSGKLLLDMINDILDLAKIESGKIDIRLTDFTIDQVIAAQCDMARPLTEKKNIDLIVQIEPRLPPLHQDQGKVQQILNNLLSNAIKFTPEGGRIQVAARRNIAGDLLLVVSDTGVGIAEEDQTAIFEKFRQGRSAFAGGDAMTREYSGTGLGLSIVKELCKLLGGEITLLSELGKGSTFTVRLPWVLMDQPKLDSPLADSIDELTRPRRGDVDQPLDDTRLPPAPAPSRTG